VVADENLKRKEKARWWSLSLTGVVAYESFFISEFKWQVKRGFTMLVVTGAGRSQGEL